jgi:hypothetical protein
MTVKELIEQLSQFEPDTPVVVKGYEAGFNDVYEVELLSIQLNTNTIWYYGAHGTNDDQQSVLPDVPMSNVVYLHSCNHIASEDWHGK